MLDDSLALGSVGLGVGLAAVALGLLGWHEAAGFAGILTAGLACITIVHTAVALIADRPQRPPRPQYRPGRHHR